jgi:hypothetical protein
VLREIGNDVPCLAFECLIRRWRRWFWLFGASGYGLTSKGVIGFILLCALNKHQVDVCSAAHHDPHAQFVDIFLVARRINGGIIEFFSFCEGFLQSSAL